jgi:hypothetical protein
MVLPLLAAAARFALAGGRMVGLATRAGAGLARSGAVGIGRGMATAGRGAASAGKRLGGGMQRGAKSMFNGMKSSSKLIKEKISMKLNGKEKDPKKILQELNTLTKQSEQRAVAIRHRFLQYVTDEVQEQLYNAIPKDYTDLRNSLEVAYYSGGKDPVYVVHAPMRARPLEDQEHERTIIYVEPTRSYMKPSKRVSILQKFGPWTVDTLPFNPDPKEGRLVRMAVPAKDVVKTRKLRKRDRPRWRRQLVEAGVRLKRVDWASLKFVNASVHDSMALEFGVGASSAPHWRPAVKWAKSGAPMALFRRDNKMHRAMWDPTYLGWQRWRAPAARVTTSQLRQYHVFEKRLGISS